MVLGRLRRPYRRFSRGVGSEKPMASAFGSVRGQREPRSAMGTDEKPMSARVRTSRPRTMRPGKIEIERPGEQKALPGGRKYL